MLHNQVAINVCAAIQAKGIAKSNAQLNFLSTNLMVRVNIDLMCRKWRAKENKLQSDGTRTTTCHYKYTDKGQHVLTRTMQSLKKLALDIFYTNVTIHTDQIIWSEQLISKLSCILLSYNEPGMYASIVIQDNRY